MAKFLDGPAAGVTLMLRRSPIVLRAVVNAEGEWDALDQLTDEPQPDETVVVYIATTEPMRWHQRCARKAQTGWYESREYVLLDNPPDDDYRVRDMNAWQAWCLAEKPRLMMRHNELLAAALKK